MIGFKSIKFSFIFSTGNFSSRKSMALGLLRRIKSVWKETTRSRSVHSSYAADFGRNSLTKTATEFSSARSLDTKSYYKTINENHATISFKSNKYSVTHYFVVCKRKSAFKEGIIFIYSKYASSHRISDSMRSIKLSSSQFTESIWKILIVTIFIMWMGVRLVLGGGGPPPVSIQR